MIILQSPNLKSKCSKTHLSFHYQLEIKVKITVVPQSSSNRHYIPPGNEHHGTKHMINKGNVQAPWLPCDWQVNHKQLCVRSKQILHASHVLSKYDRFFSFIWKGASEILSSLRRRSVWQKQSFYLSGSSRYCQWKSFLVVRQRSYSPFLHLKNGNTFGAFTERFIHSFLYKCNNMKLVHKGSGWEPSVSLHKSAKDFRKTLLVSAWLQSTTQVEADRGGKCLRCWTPRDVGHARVIRGIFL